MSRKLNAYLDGKLAGWFEESQGQIHFSYAPDAQLPISLSMPLSTTQHKNKATSAYLWGLLPDNQEALASMAREAGCSANSVFGLLSFHGRDVAGAVQLLPEGEAPTDAIKNSVDTVSQRLSDHDIEALLIETMARYQGGTPISVGDGTFKFSIAGAQPKIALTADRDEQFLPPSKHFPTTHIIKPNDPRSNFHVSEMDTLEVMCLAAARELGLDAADAYLWHAPSGDMSAVITERYDRVINADGTIDRLHQEDMCQALSVMPEKKYQHEHGGPGLGDIRNLLSSKLPPTTAAAILNDFFKAVVFNVGIVGTDAHAKNYSIMIEPSQISLAPLYDTISAASHASKYSTVNFPMKIDKTYSMSSISPSGLISAGMKIGIPEDTAASIVHEILGSLPSAIETVAKIMGEQALGQSVLDGLEKFSPTRFLH